LTRACAFLAPDAIPEEIFTNAADSWGEPLATAAADPLLWLRTLEEAGGLALISRDAGNKTLEIHRLVQEVVKDGMGAETRRAWAQRAVSALSNIFPDPEFRNWATIERLVGNARAAANLIDGFDFESSSADRVLTKAAWYLDDRGQYSDAELLYRRSLAISEKANGSDHAHTAIGLNNLAAVYLHQGRDSEAEPLFKRALQIRETLFGLDDPVSAQILYNLGLAYSGQGRYGEAEPLYRRSVAIVEKVLGPGHPHTARTINNLGVLYSNRARYTEAEPLLQRALAIREATIGPDHPDTATTLNSIAIFYERQSRYSEAEPLFRRACAIREAALGSTHPHTILSLQNYAALLRTLNRPDEAAALEARLKPVD
jgi:tetratricopeptide (TPR) repeat protein